jgi:hypothetical protein
MPLRAVQVVLSASERKTLKMRGPGREDSPAGLGAGAGRAARGQGLAQCADRR